MSMAKTVKPRSPTDMKEVGRAGRGEEKLVHISKALMATWFERSNKMAHATISDVLAYGYDRFQKTYATRFSQMNLRDSDGQVKRILDHSTENAGAYGRTERSINMDDEMVSEIQKWANDALTSSSVICELLIAYGMIHCDQSIFPRDKHHEVFEQHMERLMRKEQIMQETG